MTQSGTGFSFKSAILFCGTLEKDDENFILPKHNTFTPQPLVFAYDQRWLAIASIPKLDRRDYNFGYTEENEPYIFIRDILTFRYLLSLQCFIYKVANYKFQQDTRLNKHVFISYEKVSFFCSDYINILSELSHYKNLKIYYLDESPKEQQL